MNDHVLALETDRIQIQTASLAADPRYGVPTGLKISGRGRADKTTCPCYRDAHGIILLDPG